MNRVVKVGEVFESKNYGPFLVTEDLGLVRKISRFNIKFLKTGYCTEANKYCILIGAVRDKSVKYVQGVGVQIGFSKY